MGFLIEFAMARLDVCIYIYMIYLIYMCIYIMICSIQKWRMRESLKDISYNVYNDVC